MAGFFDQINGSAKCIALDQNPIVSMYGIFTYIYHKNQLNVGI